MNAKSDKSFKQTRRMIIKYGSGLVKQLVGSFISYSVSRKKLISICENWEQQSRVAFRAASDETDDFGKRFIEYGATIKFNHSQELRRLLNG